VAPEHRPGPAEERARYETHENDPEDRRYRDFLSRLADPLVARLPPGAEGLDYGSGPGPTLSVMLSEQGFPMEIWDPFFAPGRAPLQRSYDFITCTETAEHFFHPRDEFDRLNRLLRPGGWLALMTRIVREGQSFSTWRYARDPTHVCFYRPETMTWIATQYDWSPEYPDPDVVLFRKE
jgi:SAM-dependent methyltransferase